MKVMFINPPNSPFNEKNLLIEPIDMLTVASYIQSIGHEVTVIDMDAKQMLPDLITKVIKVYKPHVTVIPFDYHIPLHSSESIEGINIISSIAKQHGSKVIVSGKTAKHFPEAFLKRDTDIIINGEMELTLRGLLNLKDWSIHSLSKVMGISFTDDNGICTTKPRLEKIDLNALPIPNRGLVDLNDYIDVRTILSSRGCAGKCGFCPTPDFWGTWRGKNAKNVVDDIEHLINNYGASKILFLDDNATVNKERMKSISNEIITRGLKATFGCLGTISSYDKETLEFMYEAGFRWIHYGVESGSQKVLDRQKKGLDIKLTKKVLSETKQIGFRIRTSFILDLPEADEESTKETIDLILDTQPHEIRLHYLSLRAGTRVYEELASSSEMPSQYIHSDKPVLKNDSYSKDKILRDVEYLIQELRKINYLVIKNATDWRDVKGLAERNPELKFVSLCPSRYGLNWEL